MILTNYDENIAIGGSWHARFRGRIGYTFEIHTCPQSGERMFKSH